MPRFPHSMSVVWYVIESFLLSPSIAQVGKKQKLITEKQQPKGHMFMHLNFSENWSWVIIPISIFSGDD